MKFNFQPISNVLGILLVLYGVCMLMTGVISLLYEASDAGAFFTSGGITIITGIILKLYKFSNEPDVNKKEGYLIVALGWLLMCFFGALPFYLSGFCPSFTDAVFETASGLTTTGASIFNDVEILPHGVLFWRSMTHFIGGLGIIVLTVALLPILGIGGIELFSAEASGPTADRLQPRIKETAKRLWYIYLFLTLLCTLFLLIAGMNLFDAICHAFSTLSTGGFSTKNASIAFYQSPGIEYIITLFMFLGGANFSVLYYFFKGNFYRVWYNDEFRYYLYFTIIVTLVLTVFIQLAKPGDLEESFRHALFQLITVITTTGFMSYDFTFWHPTITLLFFLLLFVGGCAGSTAGGIKFIRHTVFVKNTFLEFRRILHPRALIRLKINDAIVPPRILTHILVFLLVYLMVFVIGTVGLSFTGLDFETALGASASCLGNVGPAIGKLHPTANFSIVSNEGKWICSFLMVLGRLELFTILILFSRSFWRVN